MIVKVMQGGGIMLYQPVQNARQCQTFRLSEVHQNYASVRTSVTTFTKTLAN